MAQSVFNRNEVQHGWLLRYGMLLATFALADAYLGDFEPDGMPDLTEEMDRDPTPLGSLAE